MSSEPSIAFPLKLLVIPSLIGFLAWGFMARATTAAARATLCFPGLIAWFAATTGLGYLLGHGLAAALSFAVPFLFPTLVVSSLFAALVQPRPNAQHLVLPDPARHGIAVASWPA